MKELFLHGPIGPFDISCSWVREQLAEVADDEPLTVHLASLGGDCFEGAAIYALLSGRKGGVTVIVDSVAASMGSFIACAGDMVKMQETALWLVHPPWTVAAGNAAELRATANDLDRLEGAIVAGYQGACKRRGKEKTGKAISELMAEDRFMTAAEALAYGFIDEIIPAKGNEPAPVTETQASVRAAMLGRAQRREFQALKLPTAPAETDMKAEILAKALGLADGADETTILGRADALASFAVAVIAVLGCGQEDKALGLIQANATAAAELPKAQARIAELEGARAKAERDALLASCSDKASPNYGKLTPALRAWAEKQPIETLTAWLAAAPRVLGKDDARQATTTDKTWDEMTPLELHELHDSNPEAYEALKAAHEAQAA